MKNKHKLIIDTDPGVDDALAIMLAAYSPQVELLGLTTVFGNVSVEQATANAGFLASLLPQAVPVARGENRPLVIASHGFPDFVHGKNGFGDIDIAYPPDFRAHTLDAADFIIQQLKAQPGEVTLAPIGPLTNIATALQRAPEIAQLAKAVVLMGGSVHHRGNVSPVAEANIWNDPHAAQAVFSADWPVTMVGLNVTHDAVMHEDRIAALVKDSPKVCGFLAKICAHYARFYRHTVGFDGFCVHDPAAIACLLQPELFSTQHGQVEVVCDGPAMGQTVFSPQGHAWAQAGWDKRSNVQVCTTVQSEAVMVFMEDVLRRAP